MSDPLQGLYKAFQSILVRVGLIGLVLFAAGIFLGYLVRGC